MLSPEVRSGIEFFPDRRVELQPALQGLEPSLVWTAFSALLNIPRDSKHESQVRDALVRLADRRGFEHQTDEAGNLVIRTPGRGRGCGAPNLAIQAHMDMVCAALKDSTHDFSKDPIKPVLRKGTIRGEEVDVIGADGTTLGADNGIGLVLALALAEDKSLTDLPPLELVFTVDEETGLHGARRIGKDMITALNLINLDSEDLGEICRSCAGSFEFFSSFNLTRLDIPTGFVPLTISLENFPSGHSGVEIHKGIVNPIVVLNEALLEIVDSEALLGSIKGGNKRNIIPASAEGVIWVSSDRSTEIESDIRNAIARLLPRLFPNGGGEGELKFSYSNSDEVPAPIASEDSRRFLAGVRKIFHGVVEMSDKVPGLVATSNNLAIVETEESHAQVICMARSSKPGGGELFVSSTIDEVKKLGGKAEMTDSYEGWEPEPDSQLNRIVIAAHSAVLGTEPKVVDIHAGLECGPFKRQRPDLHMVSFGPDITGAHSVNECVGIKSVDLVWQILKKTVVAFAEVKA